MQIGKMEPVITFPYSEFRVAERLADFFKKKAGFSVLLPSSRTEKGFDEPTKIHLTRGDQHGKMQDYSPHLLENRVGKLLQSFS
jgi:hypothetical protein